MKNKLIYLFEWLLLLPLLASVVGCQEEFSKVLPEQQEDSVDVIYGTPKVLLLIVDGARGQSVQQAQIPNINALLPQSIYSWNSLSEENAAGITSNWTNIFTGVNYQKHGVLDDNFENNKLDAYPLIFQRIQDNMDEEIPMALVSSNERFLTLFGEQTATYQENDDRQVTERLKSLLAEEETGFLTGHFTAIDAAGAADGYDVSVASYKNAIGEFDAQLGELIAAMKNRESYQRENWLVIVASSQGGYYEIPEEQNDNTVFSVPELNTFTIIWSEKFSTKFISKPFIGNKYIGDFVQFTGENYAQLDEGDNSIFNLDDDDFTIELKIKKNKGPNNNYSFSYPSIIGKRAHWQSEWDRETDGIGWVIHLAGESWIFNARGENGTGEVKAEQNLNRGTWNSITVTGQTVDGVRTARLYTNGELSKEGDITAWGPITSNAKFRIGYLPNKSGWNSDSYISDVKIWKTALSPEAIKQYSCEVGLDPNHPMIDFLAAYWPLNSIENNIISDEGPFQAHLTTGSDDYTISQLNDFICAPSSETLSATVPRNLDVTTQIISWLKVPRQISWGLDGRVWIDK